ncbi:MAG: type II toxin-antitoxin system HicB family antitoxin [Chloroflexota bacterium]|nr:type II toxin-antitoxin system HicB family antitoxin [Chloroflexota bacterium]MDE2961496.1 type II toxin-antitoxin system HicB family antitoxin [Chloroflexota bacterium]
MIAKIPLILEPQPEGGYTVTSPVLPELITEGDTIVECLVNAEDAFAVVLEICEDEGRSLPTEIQVDDAMSPVSVEAVVTVPVR